MDDLQTQKKKRVALYIRVSTDEQAKEDRYGIKVQEDRLQKFCESQQDLYDIENLHVYKDEGKSGSLAIEKREGLRELFDDAKEKKFDIVIVYRLDRFFRSTRRLLDAVERLLETGIEFKSCTESFDTSTPNGRLVLQMLGALAEHEREVIRERMSGGREQAARDNKWVTGVPPYGYRVDKKTKQLHIVPEEAEVVRTFYRWLVYEHCSLTEITKRANEMGLPAPKHNTQKRRNTFNCWWKRSINRILVNEVYTGDFYYRKYKRPFKYLDAVIKEDHQRPKEEWISIKVPKIISKELFQASIKQLQKNRENSKRNTKRTYLYSTLLHCGYTGHKLQSGYQAPKVDRSSQTLGKYYHTDTRNTSGSSNKIVRYQYAETRLEPIWDSLVSILEDPENIVPRLEEYTFKNSSATKAQEKIAECDKQIQTLREQRTRINTAFVYKGISEKDYKQFLDECEKRVEKVANKKAKFEQMLMKRQERGDRNDVLKSLYQTIKTRLENTSYEDKQYILRLFVERINLFYKHNYAEVFFRFPASTAVKQNENLNKKVPRHNNLHLVLHIKTLSERERRRNILMSNTKMHGDKSLA